MQNDSYREISQLGATADILPAQYFARRMRSGLLEGEQRLMLAVLADAVRAYVDSKPCKTPQQRLTFAGLRYWFFATGKIAPQGLFAFESICEAFKVDPRIIRERLKSTAGSTAAASGRPHSTRARGASAAGRRTERGTARRPLSAG